MRMVVMVVMLAVWQSRGCCRNTSEPFHVDNGGKKKKVFILQ